MEICINGLKEISVQIELPYEESKSFFKIFKKSFKHIETLSSRFDLQNRTRQYFTLSPKELMEQLK